MFTHLVFFWLKPGTPDSIAINKRHRILRRGRSYGPWLGIDGALSPPAADEPERGLHFSRRRGKRMIRGRCREHDEVNG